MHRKPTLFLRELTSLVLQAASRSLEGGREHLHRSYELQERGRTQGRSQAPPVSSNEVIVAWVVRPPLYSATQVSSERADRLFLVIGPAQSSSSPVT